MRRLKKLATDTGSVYASCTSGVSCTNLVARLNAAQVDVSAIFNAYEINANANHLHLLGACNRGNGDQVIIASLTKKELTDLYSVCMVRANKPGRHYYDSIMMLAPLGKCPYCGFGQVSTLDHFLSQAYYPAFSVLSSNLVPACADCNKGKGSSVVTEDTQMLHPYFEGAIVETETWLFAEVVQTSPVTVKYFINPPMTWSSDLSKRVSNHFKELNLAARFEIEAASELVCMSHMLSLLPSDQLRMEHLKLTMMTESGIRKNSWKTALYQALVNSQWFQTTGYIT